MAPSLSCWLYSIHFASTRFSPFSYFGAPIPLDGILAEWQLLWALPFLIILPEPCWKSYIRWEYWKAFHYNLLIDDYSSRAFQSWTEVVPAPVESYTLRDDNPRVYLRINSFQTFYTWVSSFTVSDESVAHSSHSLLNSIFSNAFTRMAAFRFSWKDKPSHGLPSPPSNHSATRTYPSSRVISTTENFSFLALLTEQLLLGSPFHAAV